MRGVILLTDLDWFRFLSVQPELDEVNFWRPRDTRTPQLTPGTPMLFKLRKQHGGWIVGYAVFALHRVLTAELAWDSFGFANGAATFAEMVARIDRLRNEKDVSVRPGSYEIGCLMLSEPVFLPRDRWVAPPGDWPDNVVQGRSYDLTDGEGRRVWDELLARAPRGPFGSSRADQAHEGPRYAERLAKVRLGQGTFRIAVMGAYGGACAITGEHSTPALEASHIRPFALEGPRHVSNGLLFRSDVHRLFDKGYVAVDSEFRFRVSGRLRQDYSNGRSYYPLDLRQISLPADPSEQPDRDQLAWHMERVFRG